MLSYISFYFFLVHTYFLTRHFLGWPDTAGLISLPPPSSCWMFSVSWEWNRWNGFSDNLGFFPTLSHLHVHGEGKNVFIIINVAVFALYWPKVLAASAGRVERVRGGIPLQGPGLATTDNEWSGLWVLIRGIVDNEGGCYLGPGPGHRPAPGSHFPIISSIKICEECGDFYPLWTQINQKYSDWLF